jgi:hypothetical protein
MEPERYVAVDDPLFDKPVMNASAYMIILGSALQETITDAAFREMFV